MRSDVANFLHDRVQRGMNSFYELYDFRSGNVMEHFAQERDAWDALREMAMEFGIDEMHDLGLSFTNDGKTTLIAMEGDLVQRVERELSQVPSKR
jgi:hypothetical protein